MIRQNNDPGSPYYAVLAEPGDVLSVQYRTAFGGPTTVATTTTDAGLPLYLMVQRVVTLSRLPPRRTAPPTRWCPAPTPRLLCRR